MALWRENWYKSSMKTCSKCGVAKTEDSFTKRKLSADGLHPQCRGCKNAREVSRRTPIRGDYNAKERERYRVNPEPHRQKHKKRMADPVRAARKVETQRQWLASKPWKTAEYSARQREKNPEKRRQANLATYWRKVETNRKKMLEFQKNNRPIFRANGMLRHARKMNATPEWLTPDQRTFMRVTYEMADKLSALYGIKFHVDHIHPLRGQDACGLHVPWNLQVLPAFDNQSKGNRLKAA